MRHISPDGLGLIKRFEDETGYLAGTCSRLTAYQCSAGVWTCGWGHTKDITPQTTCTPALADQWLQEDVLFAEDLVSQRVTAPLTQPQFDALVSFVFNMRDPVSRFTESECTLLRLLNAGAPPQIVAAQFSRWVNAVDPTTGKKRPLAGLIRRREAERLLFLRDPSQPLQPQSSLPMETQ